MADKIFITSGPRIFMQHVDNKGNEMADFVASTTCASPKI